MKTLRLLTASLLMLTVYAGIAQVQIDKPIQLTGSGTDAKVTGIKDVSAAQDAASAEVIQMGGLIYGTTGGSSNNYTLTLTPAISAYQKGMVINFISNQTNTGPATLNVNNLGAIPVKKGFNLALAGCEIQNGQAVTAVYDGTNFQMTSVAYAGTLPTTANAGPDQLNVGALSVTLAGNTPGSGTGSWSIASGGAGTFSNSSSPASTFTGTSGTTYVLVWTISTGSCGSSTDSVSISFANLSSYTSWGSYTFVVPPGVNTITIQCWGAQGGNAGVGVGPAGGLGGYSTGNLAVSPGDNLNVNVGQMGGGPGTAQTFGGGGNASFNPCGAGGGASDVRANGTGIGNRVIVAGGGGGSSAGVGTGGAGGGLTGGNGSDNNAFGGTQSSYGSGSCCPCPAPSQGNGQDGFCGGCNGSGGGGGYYGGGACTQGGGGSGYIGGVTGGSMQNGVQSGDGKVVISW